MPRELKTACCPAGLRSRSARQYPMNLCMCRISSCLWSRHILLHELNSRCYVRSPRHLSMHKEHVTMAMTKWWLTELSVQLAGG